MCICQYDKYNSKKLYSTVYVYGSYDLQSERSPEMFMISKTTSIGGTSKQSDGSRNVEESLPAFGLSFAKPFLLKIGYS